LLAFLGVAGVFIAAADEYICFDRSPWTVGGSDLDLCWTLL
jgi:hypothetical protein